MKPSAAQRAAKLLEECAQMEWDSNIVKARNDPRFGKFDDEDAEKAYEQYKEVAAALLREDRQRRQMERAITDRAKYLDLRNANGVDSDLVLKELIASDAGGTRAIDTLLRLR